MNKNIVTAEMQDRQSRYDDVWRRAEPYMRARKNDIHIPISYSFAERLLEVYPDADDDIVLLAILLHDIGWFAIDEAEIMANAFNKRDMMTSDTRILHEIEGVRLAKGVLSDTGWSTPIARAVCEIIDGHDTRPEAKSLNDRLVRDADKLWRYTPTGVALAHEWHGFTPAAYGDWLTEHLDDFETEEALRLAKHELAKTHDLLKLNILC